MSACSCTTHRRLCMAHDGFSVDLQTKRSTVVMIGRWWEECTISTPVVPSAKPAVLAQAIYHLDLQCADCAASWLHRCVSPNSDRSICRSAVPKGGWRVHSTQTHTHTTHAHHIAHAHPSAHHQHHQRRQMCDDSYYRCTDQYSQSARCWMYVWCLSGDVPPGRLETRSGLCGETRDLGSACIVDGGK